MNITTHTPEPWATMYAEGDAYISISDDNLGLIAAVPRNTVYPYNENAARIVACVNEFAGVADPAAEMARLRAIERRVLAQSAKRLPAAVEEALAIIERNTPCAHENYEVAGFNFRKCSDCGAMVANERAARAGQGARAYEAACGTLRVELARLQEVERCARALVEAADTLVNYFPRGLDALKSRG